MGRPPRQTDMCRVLKASACRARTGRSSFTWKEEPIKAADELSELQGPSPHVGRILNIAQLEPGRKRSKIE
jgi:hypothetical protein